MNVLVSKPLARSLAAAALAAALAAGCEPYHIEYHRRPAYYQQMNEEPLPDRIVLDDGTVMIYRPREEAASTTLDPDGAMKKFEIREEHPDGSVTLRAVMPVHVIANVLHSLRYEEYELLWEQLVARETKRIWEAEGKGVEDFSAFMRKNRLELAQMLNRMRIGLATNQTVVDKREGGVLECRFWPQTAMLFEFKKVVLVREDYGLKLLAIR